MKIEEALVRLRDDLKEWVTNNLNAIGKPKASDVKIDTPSGMTATDVQGAVSELNEKNKWKLYKQSVGTVTATSAVSVNISEIDNTVNEYKVVVQINLSTVTQGVFTFDVIPKCYGFHMQGYYFDAAYSACIGLSYSSTAISVTNKNTWTTVTAPNLVELNATVSVYYR